MSGLESALRGAVAEWFVKIQARRLSALESENKTLKTVCQRVLIDIDRLDASQSGNGHTSRYREWLRAALSGEPSAKGET